MAVREHHTGDKLSPQEFIVTAYYLDTEESGRIISAEEMDFIVTPGDSQSEIMAAAKAFAERELDPDGWQTIRIGQPSVPMVRW